MPQGKWKWVFEECLLWALFVGLLGCALDRCVLPELPDRWTDFHFLLAALSLAAPFATMAVLGIWNVIHMHASGVSRKKTNEETEDEHLA